VTPSFYQLATRAWIRCAAAMATRVKFDPEEAVAEFIKRLRTDLDDGYRVLPFVGAGFSVAAGFPLVADLSERELPYWILRALGLNPLASVRDELRVRGNAAWNPRTGGWPDMAGEIARSVTRPNEELFSLGGVGGTPYSKKRAVDVLTLAIEVLKRAPEVGGLTYSIVSEALESLNRDWRGMIEYLARLQWREHQGKRILSLGTIDDSVTDSLFRHLNQRRKPALSHRMIESLATVWRSHVLLTTNFDTLIEQAFHTAGTSLEPFDVPRSTSLPDAGLVLAQRSLVKLHGGRFGMRADQSIDRPSDDLDVENFLAYLAAHRVSREPCNDKIAIFASGLSGRDRRTQSLLWAACERFKRLRIYWLRFTDRLPEFLDRQRHGRDGQILDLAHPDHGLFLLQLYQAVTYTIPTSGVIFPGLWQLTAPPVIPRPKKARRESSSDREDSLVRSFESARARLQHAVQDELKRPNRGPIVLRMSKGDRGGMTVCASLFTDADWQQKMGLRFLWQDLDDVAQPIGVCLRLILMAAKADGDPDPICTLNLHAFDGCADPKRDDDAERGDAFFSALFLALAHSYARSGRRLLVFLNAQEEVGSHSTFTTKAGRGGWNDEASVKRLYQVLVELNEHGPCGVQFVFVVRDRAPGEARGISPFYRYLDDFTRAEGVSPGKSEWRSWRYSAIFFRHIQVANSCSAFAPETAVRFAVQAWLQQPKTRFDRLRAPFLMALAMFRPARYPAGLVRVLAEYFEEIEGREKMRVEDLADEIGSWIGVLEAHSVLRRKSGGFVWLNSELRKLLRLELQLHWTRSEHYEPWADAFLRLGSLIARWYGRILLASMDPLAAVEGAHHALESIRVWAETVRSEDAAGWQRIPVALDHAELLLRTGRPLFERRLSSQFAEQSLEVLQGEAEETLSAISKAESVQSMRTFLRDGLHKFLRAIVRLRSVVALRESEHHRVLDLWHRPFSATGFPQEGAEWASLARDLHANAVGALIYLRRYPEAERECDLLWTSVGLVEVEGNKKGFEAARSWISSLPPHGPEDSDGMRLKCLVARLARWRLYLLLNRSQVRYLSARGARTPSTSGNDPWPERYAALNKALWFYDFGIEVLRAAPGIEDGFVFEENVRLRAHAALCRGILEVYQGNERTTRATMLLADGKSYFGEFPLNEADVNTAILNLRRAELPLLAVGNDRDLKEFRQALLCWAPAGDLTQNVFPVVANRDISKGSVLAIAARVQDALRHLEAAEEQLERHPKSRWWWSVFCVLKLKASEYLYTLRLLRELEPEGEHHRKPRLISPDAARFFSGGIVGVVLTKGICDAFYLTRMFHSYARTMRAQIAYLHARAAAEPARGDEQTRWLEHARHRFFSRRADLMTLIAAARRALAPVDGSGPCLPPDEQVLEYFESCYEDAIQVIHFYS
jgi:hypothetical protein